MKIAIIAHCIYPIAQPYAGGLEMITHLLAKTLMENGHTVHLFAHKESDQELIIIPIYVDGEDLTIEERMVLKDKKETLKAIAYSKAINYINENSYDVVHNHSLNAHAIALLPYIKSPVIHTFHTPKVPSVLSGILSHSEFSGLQYTAVSHQNASIWTSAEITVRTIYNGIDLAQWRYSHKTSGNYFFWYGRLCSEKAPHHAIEAAIKQGVHLIMAGPRYNDKYYNSYIKPYLEHPLITYVGHIKQDEINDYLCDARALFFTSIWDEPYGLVLAEGLACGTPIIAYDSGAAPELLNEDCAVIVEKGNINQLSMAIKAVDRIKRSHCRQRAEEVCCHKKMAQNYELLYCEISQSKLALL